MTQLSQKDKENIAAVIKGFYGSAIYVTPDQITEEVEEIVDKMVVQIAACSAKTQLVLTIYEVFYSKLPVRIFTSKITSMSVEALTSGWIAELKKSFSTKACANTTLANWRSPLARALIGI